ncbi:MAG: trypsin-like peptidase domain-containing protein [Proteobacteria bacterium]|nr:trypsin-like peptidase domain-containing protein [Pseudomonadota bacterium]
MSPAARSPSRAPRLLLALALSLPFALAAPVAARADDPPATGYADVVAKLLPTVVSVYVRLPQEQQTSNGGTEIANKSEQGSGFIIDPRGYIVTNRHVIEGAYDIIVVMEDGRQLRAQLVAKSNAIDLALLKVYASKPLPTVRFGDSSKLRPGDPVIAIGNPLGLGGTVTAGIVSALNRNLAESPFDDFIQIDASLNHGNSGGPLFDRHGELIGVNTAFFAPGGGNGSVGLGFSIPSNNLAWIIRQLRSHGEVRAGWIDWQTQSVSDEIAQAFGLPLPTGAIVVSVPPGSPAAKAGIKSGDIVQAVDNQPVSDARALGRAIATTPPGDLAHLNIWRDGKGILVAVPVVAWQSTDLLSGLPPVIHDAEVQKAIHAPHLGLTMEPLTEALRKQWKVGPDVKGVIITHVEPFSVADNHSVRAGMVVVSVSGKPVSTPDQIKQLVSDRREAAADHVPFLVNNKGELLWMALPISPGKQ